MLNSARLRTAAPTSKLQKLTDGGGLYLQITPAGAKSWRLEYRFEGIRRSKTLGLYPNMPLAEARAERDRIKGDVRRGIDPEPKPVRAKVTFGDMAAVYLENLGWSDPAPATLQKNRWLLNDLAKPLHDKPIAEIRARDILPVIESVAREGKRESARRLRGRIGAVFDLAIMREEAEINPVASLKSALPKVEVASTAAITDETKFAALLLAIDNYGDPTIRHALQLQALCYPRPVETRMARWADIEGDVWRIPPETAKMRREHLIPLSCQAKAVFDRQREISGSSEWIFPNRYPRKHAVISENAMNFALEKLGYGKGIHTPHGFRSSASTILNERRWHFDVIEASLAHVDRNAVRRIYNRAAYWKERVEMAQAWSDLCDKLKARRDEKSRIL